MKRKRVTKQVRAYNVRPGDVIEAFDSKSCRVVRLTVAWCGSSPPEAAPGHVDIGFRRQLFGYRRPRMSIVRVLRVES